MVDPRRWALAVARLEAKLGPEDVAYGEAIDMAMAPPIRDRKDVLDFVRLDGDALDLARAIVVAVNAIKDRRLDERTGWDIIMQAARAAQRRYKSWRDLGEGYADGFSQLTEGRATCETDVKRELADPKSPWNKLAWDTDLEPLPIRQRFCLAIAAPVIVQGGGDPRELGGLEYSSRFSEECVQYGSAKLRDACAITTRAELIAWSQQKLHGTGERALDLARVVAAIGWAVRADIMTEEDAWHAIFVAGKLAQLAYPSWDAFAAGYLRAWIAGGGPEEPTATHLAKLRDTWSTLSWSTDLEVTLLDPVAKPRILRVSCSQCGAPRTRPSQTAYVYCDHCGGLVDYDFARACEQPLQRPGPVYETLRAELAPETTAARDAGDRERYHAIQLRLFDVWVDACPTAVPIRVRDPEYRKRYVGWLAAGDTAAAFDAESRTLEAAVHAATAKLAFATIEGRTRVLPEPYREMCDAVFAYEARRDAVLVEHGVYELHPDHASRDLQRRLGNSMFAQGWIPFLDEADARALVERTDFVREYVVLDPPKTRTVPCATCAGPLDIVEGARRVVCEHCGRLVDVIG